MLVKICGITTREAAEVAFTSGADFIGFVFAESKRKISPEAARDISRALPASVKKVGVFVNETIDKMVEIAEIVGLDYIQLHGDEPADIAAALPYKIIKAFSVTKENLAAIESYPCDYYLLDSPMGEYRGGNGITFDWTMIDHLAIPHEKILLAGGLNADNIIEAIKLTNPAGVDVSSGVETNGIKDHTKIKQFIKLAVSNRKDETIDNLHNAR
ncbi:phosphoribosylanthranilate isomerase [Oceanobacillus chungangensis]|uniref:N-(5'-phosphoribosyl)anthranilate isomerase n=1 Tax=Oceanobacillus chungangensis TaxID=1229152 RepID=A0A3D8PYH2_9BACI|nr:phosphoribosylanthranilate isomerase [Oceanobacillus chungangensis]RDW21206.1 phosphoribosylanthranilate isomerase [Oceanobacillus chungangensis]